MTVPSTANRMPTYTGTDSTDTYAYTFYIADDADLLVVKTVIATGVESTLTLATDYTVTGAGNDDGGTVVLVAGNLPSTHTLDIRRKVGLTQPTDLRNQGVGYPGTVEAALDKAMHVAQQQQDEIDRSIKFGESESGNDATFPAPSASKVIGWNSAGTKLENVAPGSVALATPGTDSVTTSTILDANVTTAKIADEAVTLAKMSDLAADTIIGRAKGAGTGVPQALTVAQSRTVLGILDWANPTTINGAVSLTTTAINKVHSVVDAGTPANYAITLDAAADYSAGDLVAFVVDKDATKIFTITRAGTDTIGPHGDTTLPLIAGAVLILESDGVDTWRVLQITGNHVYADATSTAGQTLTSGANAIIDFGTVANDSHGRITTGASWLYDIPISGLYHMASGVTFASAAFTAGNNARMTRDRDGTIEAFLDREVVYASGTYLLQVSGSATLYYAQGEQIRIRAYQDAGSDRSLSTVGTTVWISIAKVD